MKKQNRKNRLMPKGIPRWICAYDDGGKSFDRYTVVYTGHWRTEGDNSARCQYVGMSAHPFHPQGIGLWCANKNHHCDVNKWGFAPMIGRKCHLGRRIKFQDLPEDCRRLVIQDYKEIWRLK